jgi:hypothetical protein
MTSHNRQARHRLDPGPENRHYPVNRYKIDSVWPTGK